MKEVEVSGFNVSGRTEVRHLTLAANIIRVVTLRYFNIIWVTNLSHVSSFVQVRTFFRVTDHVVVSCRISDCFNSPVAVTVERDEVWQVHLHRFCWGRGARFIKRRSRKSLGVSLCGMSRNWVNGYRFAVRRRGGVASVSLVCELGGGRGGATGWRRAAGFAWAAGVVVGALWGQHVTWTGMGGASRVSHRAVGRGRGAWLRCYFLIGRQFEWCKETCRLTTRQADVWHHLTEAERDREMMQKGGVPNASYTKLIHVSYLQLRRMTLDLSGTKRNTDLRTTNTQNAYRWHYCI